MNIIKNNKSLFVSFILATIIGGVLIFRSGVIAPQVLGIEADNLGVIKFEAGSKVTAIELKINSASKVLFNCGGDFEVVGFDEQSCLLVNLEGGRSTGQLGVVSTNNFKDMELVGVLNDGNGDLVPGRVYIEY